MVGPPTTTIAPASPSPPAPSLVCLSKPEWTTDSIKLRCGYCSTMASPTLHTSQIHDLHRRHQLQSGCHKVPNASRIHFPSRFEIPRRIKSLLSDRLPKTIILDFVFADAIILDPQKAHPCTAEEKARSFQLRTVDMTWLLMLDDDNNGHISNRRIENCNKLKKRLLHQYSKSGTSTPPSSAPVRCVCKSWNTLISSAFVIRSHHSLTVSTTPSNRKPYLLDGYRMYHPQDLQPVRELHFPFRFGEDVWKFRFLDNKVVDVVNGVICVYYSQRSSFDSIILWNPAIHKYVPLPCLPAKNKPLEPRKPRFRGPASFHHGTIGIGFGYNSSKNDFKVVRVWIPSRKENHHNYHTRSQTSTLEVFSSQQGLWREASADNIKFYEFVTTTGCFLNGAIHWLVATVQKFRYRYTYSLLTFDCQLEQLRATELPEELNQFPMRENPPPELQFPMMEGRPSRPGYFFITELFKYSDMLSVLRYSGWKDNLNMWELWAMEECGAATSWKKMFKIKNKIDFGFRKAIMVREEGDVYVPDVCHLASYDPNLWINRHGVKRFYQPLNGYAYEKSMFLMDCTSARTYSNNEAAHIVTRLQVPKTK